MAQINKERQTILNSIPIFIAKTYKMIDNVSNKDVISWNQDGDAFIIYSVSRLTNQIFPKYFKHSNFLSFVRQLNMYGFHKINVTDHDNPIFKHEYFNKHDIESLTLIKRKTNVQIDNEQSLVLPTRQQKLQKQVAILKSQHQQLQNIITILMEQNKTITAQNKAFASMMSQMRDRYRKKLQTLMLMFLFGKTNKPNEDFLFPPQLSHVIQAFQQQNQNNPLYIMPRAGKKKTKNNKALMITQGQNKSEKQASQYDNGSHIDNEDKQDIYQVLHSMKSKSERDNNDGLSQISHFENKLRFQIPVSPMSNPIKGGDYEWQNLRLDNQYSQQLRQQSQ